MDDFPAPTHPPAPGGHRRAPLDAGALRRDLVRPGLLARLEAVESTGSTNTDLAGAFTADPGAWPELSVLATDFQSSGRGRLERVWQAPPRSSLAVSILFRPTLGADPAPPGTHGWLSMLCATSLAAALRETAGVHAELKWPNDVIVAGRKVAGILAQFVPAPPPGPGTTAGAGTAGGAPAVVVGTGVNVSLERGELPVPTATSLLLEHATTTDTTVILRSYLREVAALYAGFMRAGGDATAPLGGGPSLLERVAGGMATLGAPVRAELPGGTTLEGTAVGLEADGALAVRMADGGLTAVRAGDVVHLRRTDGRYA